MRSEATVKLRVGENEMHTAAEGDGPVHALDGALRKALLLSYPELEQVKITDYKVRILDQHKAASATARVVIEVGTEHERWSTVGCSMNIIEASLQALSDSYELFLLRQQHAVKTPKVAVA